VTPFVPTDEQRRAIEHPLADACVTAGAGSGKTAVLAARYLHLVLEHHLPVRRVAALTFTEKAAAQMRERIARELEARGRLGERAEIEFAPISTIHAFCARLLRLHAVDAGLDPAFQVLDEDEALLLREDAWDEAVARLVREGSGDVGVLQAIGPGKDDLLAFLERVRGAGTPPSVLAWRAGPEPFETVAARVEARARELLDAIDPSDGALVARARAFVGRLGEALAPTPQRAWGVVALAGEVNAVAPDRGRGPRPFQAARKALREALDAVREAAVDEVGHREIASRVRAVLAAVDARYARMKDERGALDFTDLEIEALALLDRLAAKGRRVAHAPAALLVDEYQDTNPLQARLLERLRSAPSPLFSVGDPKQSIYRFRRADVRVIAAEAERVGEAGRHVLRATFRARPELVDCLNGIHERLFADGAAGVAYVPLQAAGAFRDAEGPDVDLVVVDGGADCPADDRRAHEARWIASWIRDLVARGVPRAKVVRDAEGREEPSRPLSYGDVALLLRARTSLTIYEDALAACDVPFHTHKGRGFFQTEEIVDLVRALRVVQDPADDHALACLVTGPVLGGTDDDLLRVFPDPASRAAPGAAWGRLVAGAQGRVAGVVDTILRLRREALAGRLGRAVEGVLDDLGLMEAALMQPDGARRGANLRKAVALARDLERTGREGLEDLLRTLERQRDREIAESEAALGRAGEDVVRINTVHGAKGLEYPVVILADVGRRPPARREPVGFDGEGAFALSIRHPLEGRPLQGAAKRALDDEEARREEQEARRLLYVATTRAEERLLLVGSCAGRKKADGRLKDLLGWGPWLVDAIGSEPDTEPHEVAYGRGRLRLALVDPLPETPAAPRVAPTLAPGAASRARADALLAAAAAPAAPLGDTPYAVTVSDLLDFARSPADHYRHRLEPRELPAVGAAPEPDDASSAPPEEDPFAARRAERLTLWDEALLDTDAPRAALGRAVHRLIERWVPGTEAPPETEVTRVLAGEIGGPASDELVSLAREMVRRFLASPSGRDLAAAERAGWDARREVSFHARIRFPAGAVVGGFDSLLVRGSIDLWLPDASGRIRLLDHKTNPPGPRLPTPEAVAAHYAWQLRLYALAAERLLGEEVSGAALLLLDPGWGPEAIEVPVDVRGAALEEARRLCRAYAVACLEGRWPTSWADLLPMPAPSA